MRVDGQLVAVRIPVEPDQIDRIIAERIRLLVEIRPFSSTKFRDPDKGRARPRNRPTTRDNSALGFSSRASNAADTMAERSPTSLAIRK